MLDKYRSDPLRFDPKYITLKQKIGVGYFGDVYIATVPLAADSLQQLHLAAKTIKSDAMPQQRVSGDMQACIANLCTFMYINAGGNIKRSSNNGSSRSQTHSPLDRGLRGRAVHVGDGVNTLRTAK